MDLPKELLQKYLPRKEPRGDAAQTNSVAPAGSVSHRPCTKGIKKIPPAFSPRAVPAFSKDATASVPTDDVDDEDALFRQAMQGMVHQRPKLQSGNHGAFPLPLPASIVEAAVKILLDSDPVCVPQSAPVGASAGVSSLTSLSAPPAADGEDAFALAMRTVKPLKGKGRDIPSPVEAVDAAAAQGHALRALLDKDMVFDVHMAGEDVQGQLVGLDPKVLTSLISGSQSPEARLDLHGMNAAQAFQALVPFFKGAWHKGLRTVIVVTGRGMNSPTGMAVLRQKLASWLTQEPFKRVVMAFSTAQPCDGGTGSMYILLRKFRKKHPVYWERNPVDSDVF